MPFRDLQVAASYRSDTSNLIDEFYVPCLAQAVKYDRAVGFFSGQSLALAGKGVAALVERTAGMRLVASPVLSEEDLKEIAAGYELREIIARASLRALDSTDPVIHERIGYLGWLVANEKLDIRLAVRAAASKNGIYHEKVGILTDALGDTIAFTGSANETGSAWYSNFESIDVFRSWFPHEAERVAEKVAAFERLWNNTTSGLDVLPFPDALRKRLVRLAPANPPTQDVEAAPKPRHDSRKLRDYQTHAIDAWFQAGTRGILSMATGTGKTYTAICAAKQLLETKHHVATVVVVPFVHLGVQWADELRSLGFDDIVMAYGSRDSWWPKLSAIRTQMAFGLSQKHLVVVTTTDTFSSDSFQHGMKDLWPKTLLIADEMHNLGAPKALAALPSATPYRLGLSATPERWFDDEGTNALSDYFGDAVFSLPLREAIGKYLTNYEYHPILIPLTDDELEDYHSITRNLSRMWFVKKKNDEQQSAFKSLLFKRARLLGNAKLKIAELARLMPSHQETTHSIFYCGGGRDADDDRQLDKVLTLLGVDLRMRVHSFTSEEAIEERRELLDDFESGKLQGLVAIRCLDEGVDVPATRKAFILASSRNPREFIQRRGRVLRQFPGKAKAEIFDFVVIPTMADDVALLDAKTYEVERRLLRRELERVSEFASTSLNPQETVTALLPVKKAYDILDI